eukprot:949060-Pyramimonas_sp.AAC.1
MRLLKSDDGKLLEVRNQDLPLDVPSARVGAQECLRIPADNGGVHIRIRVHPQRPASAPRYCFQCVAKGAGESRAQVIAALFRDPMSNSCVRPLDSCRLRWRFAR